MSPWHKNKILIGVVLLAFIAGGILLFRQEPSEGELGNSINSEDASEVREGETKVTGEVACLPYHIVTVGQSCVKGLKGNDGKMYALNTISAGGSVSAMPEGTEVTVIGIFEPANTSVDEASVFKYDGVLVVRILERQ